MRNSSNSSARAATAPTTRRVQVMFTRENAKRGRGTPERGLRGPRPLRTSPNVHRVRSSGSRVLALDPVRLDPQVSIGGPCHAGARRGWTHVPLEETPGSESEPVRDLGVALALVQGFFFADLFALRLRLGA